MAKAKQEPEPRELDDLGLITALESDDEQQPSAADAGEKNASTIDTSVSTETIKQSIDRSRGGGTFFTLREGERAEVRFLDELTEGIKVPRHESYPKVRRTTCFRVYDKPCPHCDVGIPTRVWYAWNIHNFKEGVGRVQVAAFKVVKNGIVQQLASYFEENGSIRKINFVIARAGSGLDTTYTITPRARASTGEEAQIKVVVKEALSRKFDLKAVLKPEEVDGEDEGQFVLDLSSD